MKPEEEKSIKKLFVAYEKAEWALQDRRNRMFPPGTLVKSRMHPDWTIWIKEGSLYPHQVNTNWGHMSWRHLEKINVQGVQE